MSALNITDNDPKVLKFKRERTEQREKLKKKIQKDMSVKGFSEKNIKDFFETIYDTKGLIKKKYLSPLNTSLDLEDQQKAFEEECKNIQGEADRYITETENQIKCIKGIAQIKKSQIFDDESISKIEKALESQGPSKIIIEKINNMLGTSKYVDSLIRLILRKEPNLKKYQKNIKDFILNAESNFRKKYKNSLEFNNVDLSELKKADSLRALTYALPSLLK